MGFEYTLRIRFGIATIPSLIVIKIYFFKIIANYDSFICHSNNLLNIFRRLNIFGHLF